MKAFKQGVHYEQISINRICRASVQCDSLQNREYHRCRGSGSDTLIAALAAIEQKKEISDPKGWLMTVLNRRYYDMLRRKYRKPLVSFDVIEDIPENNAVWDKIESSEAAKIYAAHSAVL